MLDKYECTKCERVPRNEHDVLMGCLCGNRFFRLQLNSKISVLGSSPPTDKNDTSMTTKLGNIAVQGVGVYRINLKGLFQNSKNKIVSVSDSEGVIHLNLDS